ncbi:MAG: tetratricopeptide repeat protein, partial [Armatimonadota bacterium]
GVPDVLGRREGRQQVAGSIALGITSCLVIAALAATAYPRIGVWRNNVTLFTSAIAVDPKNSFAYCGLGTELIDQGDTEGAIRNLLKALKYHPEYTDARYNLAEAYREAGRIDKAIEQYKLVIRQCPRYERAHNNLGSIYALQGKYDLAIAEFKTVLKINPHHPSARNNLRNAQRAKAAKAGLLR